MDIKQQIETEAKAWGWESYGPPTRPDLRAYHRTVLAADVTWDLHLSAHFRHDGTLVSATLTGTPDRPPALYAGAETLTRVYALLALPISALKGTA
jgi:hypothetical protein